MAAIPTTADGSRPRTLQTGSRPLSGRLVADASEIDPDALLLVGHSQGGICALRVAARHGVLAGRVLLDVLADDTPDPENLRFLRYSSTRRATSTRSSERNWKRHTGRSVGWPGGIRGARERPRTPGRVAPERGIGDTRRDGGGALSPRLRRHGPELQVVLLADRRERYEAWLDVDLPAGSRVEFYGDVGYYFQAGPTPLSMVQLYFGVNVAPHVVADLVAGPRDGTAAARRGVSPPTLTSGLIPGRRAVSTGKPSWGAVDTACIGRAPSWSGQTRVAHPGSPHHHRALIRTPGGDLRCAALRRRPTAFRVTKLQVRSVTIPGVTQTTGDTTADLAERVLSEVPEGGAVVLFDGVCNFCAWSVRFAHEHDDGTLRFAPLQSEVGRVILDARGLSTDYFDSLVYVGPDGTFIKSDGAVRIARHFDWPWRAAWYARVLPRPVRDFGYDNFAKVRYRVFGKKESCMLPGPELRARFLGDPTDD